MNVLSMISIVIYTSFFIGACCSASWESKGVLKRSAGAVMLSLGWWSFCNSFFFAAETVEQAWFWHRLSAIGWCGFVSLTVFYFLTLMKTSKKKAPWWKVVLFFAPTAVLIVRNLLGETTSLAQSTMRGTRASAALARADAASGTAATVTSAVRTARTRSAISPGRGPDPMTRTRNPLVTRAPPAPSAGA